MRIPKIFFILLILFGCSKEGDTNPTVITPPQPTKFSVTISLNPSDGGSVSPTGGQYNEGQSVTFTVTPSQNYVFKNWSGSDTSSDNPLLLLVDSNKNLTVNFEEQVSDTDGDGVRDDLDQDNNTRSGVPVDDNGVMLNPIYLDENGVTIKSEEWGIVGDIGVIDGVEYLIISEGELYDRIKNGENIGNICTSKVTTTRRLFRDIDFNGDISSWDVSNVTEMSSMFYRSSFDGDISNWDVSKVTRMDGMFRVSQFNGDISNWDLSNVTLMYNMFEVSIFNGDISSWDVSKVTRMDNMFSQSKFNGDVSNWDVINVTNMWNMFSQSKFNGDISNWDVSSVTNMYGMFQDSQFNQDLSSWNVTSVTNCQNFSRNNSVWTLPKPNFTNCSP